MPEPTFADQLDAILSAIPVWVQALTVAVTGAKAITVLTPTRSDDKALDAILRVLNVLALNVGKDKNADDVPPTKEPKE